MTAELVCVFARTLTGHNRFTNRPADHQGGPRKGSASSTVDELLAKKALEIAPINYLRGRSIHDAVVIVAHD